MIKTILKKIFGARQLTTIDKCQVKGRDIQSGIIGPFGSFAWMSYDFDSPCIDNDNRFRYALALERRLVTLEASSSDAELEFFMCRLTQIPPTLLIIGGQVRVNSRVAQWLKERGEVYCREKFSCWPFEKLTHVLFDSLQPKDIFLYEYLSGLTRKKNFSVENTPKSINHFLNNEELGVAYRRLEQFGLLQGKAGEWAHSVDSNARDFRELINTARTVTSFLSAIEDATHHVQRQIELATKLDMQVYATEYGKESECICPVCSQWPKTKIILPLDLRLLNPFHFECGRNVNAVSRERLRECNLDGITALSL